MSLAGSLKKRPEPYSFARTGPELTSRQLSAMRRRDFVTFLSGATAWAAKHERKGRDT